MNLTTIIKYYFRKLKEKQSSSKWLTKTNVGQGWWVMPLIPALWEAEADISLELRSLRPVWPTWQNAVSTKNTKISQAWYWAPVISATWEAEAKKNSLNLGGRGYTEPRVCQCTLAWVTE